MLFEYQVISAICTYLKAEGHTIEQQLTETEKGDDIIAAAPDGYKVHIEAKGETSSQAHTKRYGQPFTRSQCKVHVAEAFFRAAQMLQGSQDPRIRVGLAFPRTTNHSEFVNSIDKSLERLGIEVFFVDSENNVEKRGYCTA